MAYKEYREMKVCEKSGYHYKPTPAITLKGNWLQELELKSIPRLMLSVKEVD